MTNNNIYNSLINSDDCVLIAVDIQDEFINKLDKSLRAPMVNRCQWLIKVANALSIPVIVMAEDIGYSGTVTENILNVLATDTHVFDKNYFGLAGHPEILQAIKDTGRNTCVVIGLETDVCVSQSALGLMQEGYDVVIPEDAVASPANGQMAGIKRMSRAGALISSTKSVSYEWVGSVTNLIELSKKCDLYNNVPEGVYI